MAVQVVHSSSACSTIKRWFERVFISKEVRVFFFICRISKDEDFFFLRTFIIRF